MKRLLTMVPLLIIPVIFYNCIALATGGPTPDAPMPIDNALQAKLFSMGMLSGGAWSFRLQDVVMLLAFIALFVELLKATNTRAESLVNHGLSIALLLVCMFEFIVFRDFASSVFFLLTVACLLDVIAGFVITIVAARRDIGVGQGLIT